VANAIRAKGGTVAIGDRRGGAVRLEWALSAP